jgi:ATP-grasp domain, R2K clade family 2
VAIHLRDAVLDGDDEEPAAQHALDVEFQRRGFTTRWASAKQLERRRVVVDRSSLAVGGLPFIRAALRQLSVEMPAVDDYPASLSDHMHRTVWPSTIGQLRGALERGSPLFAKPRLKRKRFVAQVFAEGDELPLVSLPSGLAVWCGEPVVWRSEFRVFVVNGVELDRRNYDGDPLVEPDGLVVGQCIALMGLQMAGYALDIGVLDSGQTAVVEVNEGFSLGGYGVSPTVMADVLIARWTQLVRTTDA